MWLTAQNAKEYIGKKLDKKGRKGRHYPIEVFQWSDGTYGYTNQSGIGMIVPENTDNAINNVYFDIVDGVEVMEQMKGASE